MISNMHRNHQMRTSMTNYQFSRMGDKEAEIRSELYFHKMMNQADRFAKFKDPINRYYLISAFVNLVILHAEAGNIPLKECLNMSKTMERIYAQPESQAILQKDSLLNEYAKLKAVVRDGRYDKYYTLYKRYMSDKKPVKTTKKE